MVFEIVKKYRNEMLRCFVGPTILFRKITMANFGTARPIIPNGAAMKFHFDESTISSFDR